jgi:hypothetical protein
LHGGAKGIVFTSSVLRSPLLLVRKELPQNVIKIVANASKITMDQAVGNPDDTKAKILQISCSNGIVALTGSCIMSGAV